MKAASDISINGKMYKKGTPFKWYMIYPFFLVHMLAFGLSGFFMAYSSEGPGLGFLYMHGGLAIVVYTVFYLAIFGADSVKWMFFNAGIGLFGIYAQIDWILALFGKHAADYSWQVHLVPFLYYILYTFLLYQVVLDVSGARTNPQRRNWVFGLYAGISLLAYGIIYLIER